MPKSKEGSGSRYGKFSPIRKSRKHTRPSYFVFRKIGEQGWIYGEIQKIQPLQWFAEKRFVFSLIFLGILAGGLVMYADPNNQLFHNIESNGAAWLDASALAQSCALWHIPATCRTVAGQTMDPTYPITKYTAPNSNLGEFNTAGNVVFTTSCDRFNTTKCMKLVATVAPPPLAVQFNIRTTIKTTGATVIPTSFSTVYKRVTSISSNNTFQFDVTGGHAQTGTYDVTTFATTTLTFYGTQPTVTCSSCSTQIYTGYSEVLTVPSGQTDTLITVVWPTGSNLNCLCALAETVSPIGDLSPVNSKELEFSAYFSLPGVPNDCGGLPNNCAWGFFLTTNSTLWQTNNQNFDPRQDGSVTLVDEIAQSAGIFYSNLYIQQKIGETIASEDHGCTGGGSSAYLCTQVNTAASHFGAVAYMDLNYTGGSTAAQVGNGVNCGGVISGGSSCSYNVLTTLTPVAIGAETAAVTLPTLPLSQTYYLGFFLLSGELKQPIYFCYDTGAFCSAQQTFVANTCVTAAMEFDSCVPTPISTSSVNAVPSVTDSGGFVGALWRGLTTAGSWIAGVTKPLWGPVSSFVGSVGGSILNDFISGLQTFAGLAIPALGTALSYAEAFIVLILNTVGNAVGLGPLGSNIQTLIGQFVIFFTGSFPSVFGFLANGFTILFNRITVGVAWVNFAIGTALNIAALLVNGVTEVVTIGKNLLLIAAGLYAVILMILWFMNLGDYGAAGGINWLSTTEWLILGTGIRFVIEIVNFGIDIISGLISLIPKPFIQMHNIPGWARLPGINSTAQPTFPDGHMQAIRDLNVFAISGWLVGFVFFVWFESTGLPGSIGAAVPGSQANLSTLSSLLPIYYVLLFVLGACFLAFLPATLTNAIPSLFEGREAMKRDTTLSFRAERPPSGGFGIAVARRQVGQGRFQGRVERKRAEAILKKTGRPASVGPETKKEETFRETAQGRKAELGAKLKRPLPTRESNE